MAGKSVREELVQLCGAGGRSAPSFWLVNSSGRRFPYHIRMPGAILGSGNAVQDQVVSDSVLLELPFQGSQRSEHTSKPVRSRQAVLTGQGAASVHGVERQATQNRERKHRGLVVRGSPGKEAADRRSSGCHGLGGIRMLCVWQTDRKQ